MTSHAPIVLPPIPDLRVALLVLHAQAGGDFFGDTALAWVGGQLRAAGIAADLWHVHYPRGGGEARAKLDQEILVRLNGYHLIAVDQAWDESLLQALQDQGARLAVTDPFAVWRSLRVDVRLQRFGERPQTLIDVALALRNGSDLRQIDDLILHLHPDTPAVTTAIGPASRKPAQLEPFTPIPVPCVIGVPVDLDGRTPPVRRTLETSAGCPFSDPATDNPLYAGVDLSDPRVNTKGCTFCFMGGDYRAEPVATVIARSVAQIRYWQAELPQLDEVILRDQSALRYLPELVIACQQAGLRPVGLLVPGRGDAILRYGPQLRAAAEACQNTAWWFTIHLIGFESFSQGQLDLYNKGVTVEDYAAALAQLRDLHGQMPLAFRLYAYGASSLVLFNPWTTLQQLQETVDFCRDHAVGALAHGLTMTRLRLYPNLPLYWLARRDGLLDDDVQVLDRGAQFTGYSAEATWRYRHAEVDEVERLQRALAGRVRPEHAVGLLDAVLRCVRDAADPQALDVTQITNQFEALQQLWQPQRAQQAVVLDGDAVRQAQARTVRAGRRCNQRCVACVAEHAAFADDPDQLRAAVVQAAPTGQLVLAGREPALLPNLLDLLRTARDHGAKDIELLSNGAFLAAPMAVQRLQRAGVTRLAIKRHRLADADEDAFVRTPGSAQRQVAGLQMLRNSPLRLAIVLIPTRDGWHELPDLLRWAQTQGAREVRVQVLAGELPLDHLPTVANLLRETLNLAEQLGLRSTLEGP